MPPSGFLGLVVRHAKRVTTCDFFAEREPLDANGSKGYEANRSLFLILGCLAFVSVLQNFPVYF